MNADKIFAEIIAERERQIAKWGDARQGPDYSSWPRPSISSAALAKITCQRKFNRGEGSYSDILVEEVAEAVAEAAAGDVEKLRTELVQVAAVAVAWIQLLDRETDARHVLGVE